MIVNSYINFLKRGFWDICVLDNTLVVYPDSVHVPVLGATWETKLKKMLQFCTLAPYIASIECNEAIREGFVEKYSLEPFHLLVRSWIFCFSVVTHVLCIIYVGISTLLT